MRLVYTTGLTIEPQWQQPTRIEDLTISVEIRPNIGRTATMNDAYIFKH